MTITERKTILNLVKGNTVQASSMKEDLQTLLLDEGLIITLTRGSRRSYKATNTERLKRYMISKFEEFRIVDFSDSIKPPDTLSRAKQASSTGNSKLFTVRSCPGFPVNSYEKIDCKLNNTDFVVNPIEGSFVYICDWHTFSVPTEAIVIGIENMENFRMIRSQKRLFEDYLNLIGLNPKSQILFVSRYPQSTDLRIWLNSIPNTYIHFGDFDLAGINIYLTEFKKHIESRSFFLIPNDIEARIAKGSSRRYNDQYPKFHNISSSDSDIQRLIDIINKYHKCYDQEGYIE